MSMATADQTPNVVLTGFMGTGKSVVGQRVAARLGRPFVDMDLEIERRAGRSIRDIFAQEGEEAFRRLEAALCRELARKQGLVIATGGGALTFDGNRRALGETGLLICLTASVDEILRRLDNAHDRPLLATPDRRARIEALLERRAAAYAAIPHQIDTTGLTPDQVAERVIALATPAILPVRAPEGSYDILLGPGLLAELGRHLRARGLRGPVAVVTNTTVGPLYGERAVQALRRAGYAATLLSIPDGEVHKTPETVRKLYDRFAAARLERQSTVVALGGGVVGDVVGFAAATYLRGVPLVQAPTTLLAMVDASVGGKVGVDLPQGKNLVGAFKQPALVVADTETLATLPPAEWRAGLAEVVKHGLIGAPALLERLEQGEERQAEGWLAKAIRVKVAVVEEDPFEAGRRAVLNLGHTFAHAIEQATGYGWRHGDAVAVGLVAACHLSAARGDCTDALTERIESLLRRLGLPVRATGLDPMSLYRAMSTDKKRRGGRLRFVLVRAPGDVFVADNVPTDAVQATLRWLTEGGQGKGYRLRPVTASTCACNSSNEGRGPNSSGG